MFRFFCYMLIHTCNIILLCCCGWVNKNKLWLQLFAINNCVFHVHIKYMYIQQLLQNCKVLWHLYFNMCYVILQHFFVLMISGAAYAAALYEMTSIHCKLQHRGKRVYVGNTPPAYCCLDICASVNPNIFRADYSDVCIFNVALAVRKARSIMALVQRRAHRKPTVVLSFFLGLATYPL